MKRPNHSIAIRIDNPVRWPFGGERILMKVKPIAQLQYEGVSALIEKLGPVDTARFIRIFYPGTGDYTAERRNLFNESMDDLVAEMKILEDENPQS